MSVYAAREMFAFDEDETMSWLSSRSHDKAVSSIADFAGANIQKKTYDSGRVKGKVDAKVKLGRRR